MMITTLILLVFCLIILILSWKKFAIWHWQHHLSLRKHLRNFQKITTQVDGFALSKQARANQDAFEYVYGEIEFISFIALLSLCHPHEKTVFYDLGSGTGKAVFACAMVFPVQKSCGIELFSGLHEAAKTQRSQLAALPEYKFIDQRVKFVNDNFLNADIQDATLIFINATSYFGATWNALNQRLEQLSTGPIIITTSKRLSSKCFRMQRETWVQMSWGVVKAYIHERS